MLFQLCDKRITEFTTAHLRLCRLQLTFAVFIALHSMSTSTLCWSMKWTSRAITWSWGGSSSWSPTTISITCPSTWASAWCRCPPTCTTKVRARPGLREHLLWADERQWKWGMVAPAGRSGVRGIDNSPDVNREQLQTPWRDWRECRLKSCLSYAGCSLASRFIPESVTSPCVWPRPLLCGYNGLPITLCSRHKGRLVQQQEGRGGFSHRLCISFRGVNKGQRSTAHLVMVTRMITIITI